MTPEDLEQSRRHAARMSDQELGALYVRGPESWPPEAWVILEQETARRQRARRVAEFTTSETYQGSSDQYGRSEDAQIQIVVVGGEAAQNAGLGCIVPYRSWFHIPGKGSHL